MYELPLAAMLVETTTLAEDVMMPADVLVGDGEPDDGYPADASVAADDDVDAPAETEPDDESVEIVDVNDADEPLDAETDDEPTEPLELPEPPEPPDVVELMVTPVGREGPPE